MQNCALGQEIETIWLPLSDVGRDHVPVLPAVGTVPAVDAELVFDADGDEGFAVPSAFGTFAAPEASAIGGADDAGELVCVRAAAATIAATTAPASDRIVARRTCDRRAGSSCSQMHLGGSGVSGLIDVIRTLFFPGDAMYWTQ